MQKIRFAVEARHVPGQSQERAVCAATQRLEWTSLASAATPPRTCSTGALRVRLKLHKAHGLSSTSEVCFD